MGIPLTIRIEQMRGQLTPVEIRLAAYFVQYRDSLPNTGTATIAQACATSKPAIVRFCKKLGYQGYKDLLNALSAELAVHRAQRIDTTYTRLGPMSTPEICNLTLLFAHDIVSDVRQTFNLQQVEQGVSAVEKAARLIIMGWPDSAVNAVDAQAKFSRVHIPIICATDAPSRAKALKAMRADDLLLLYPCVDALPEAEAARRQISAVGGTSLTVTVDEQQHAAIGDGLLLSATLKGHLRDYGDMDRTLANSVLTAMLYLCMVSQQAGKVAADLLAQG